MTHFWTFSMKNMDAYKKITKIFKSKPKDKKGSNTIYILIILMSGIGAETVYTDVLDQEIFPSQSRIQQEAIITQVQQDIQIIREVTSTVVQQQQQTVTTPPSAPADHTHPIITREPLQFEEIFEEIKALTQTVEEHQHEIIPTSNDHVHKDSHTHEDPDIEITSLQDEITALKIDIQDHRDKVSRGEIGGGRSGGGPSTNRVNQIVDDKLAEFESTNDRRLEILLDRLTTLSIITNGIADDTTQALIQINQTQADFEAFRILVTQNLQLCDPAEFNNPFCL